MTGSSRKNLVLALICMFGCTAETRIAQPGISRLDPSGARRPAPPSWTLNTRSYFVDGRTFEAKQAFDRGHYSKARRLLEGQGNSNPVRFLSALAALRSNNPSVAANEFLALAKTYRELEDYCLFYAAMGLERSGEVERARETYSRVAQSSAVAVDAKLALSRLGMKARRAVVADSRETRVEASALFRTFWSQRRNGELQKALETLDALESAEGGDDTDFMARYWRARLFEESGERARATALYAALVDVAPGSYYGMLARQRQAQLSPVGAEREAERSANEQSELTRRQTALAALYADENFAAGMELLRLGLPEAVRELSRVELAGKPAEAKPFYLRVLFDAGNKKQVALLSSEGSLAGAPTAETEPVWRMAFPRAYRELVERSAAKGSVDPNLLQALVREESRFNPNVRSSAGAIGLAQLMPTTAEIVARKAGVDVEITEEALLQPHHNLKLASLYLSSLLKEFDGNPALAVAAYNAGPGAVARWLKEHPELETDEWVEEIPFGETRHYVKRVLASYASYELLAQREAMVVASR